jgi:hypothetical protein
MKRRGPFVTGTHSKVAQEGYYMASDTLIALAMMIGSALMVVAIIGFIALLINME